MGHTLPTLNLQAKSIALPYIILQQTARKLLGLFAHSFKTCEQLLLRTQLGIDDENSIFDAVVWQMLRKPFEVFSKTLEFVFDTLHGGMRLMASFVGGILARLMEFVERRLILRSFDVFPLTGV
jgi:hypothetical protein